MAPELIDDRVSLAQCKKAIEALHKHATDRQAEREAKELLPGKEQNVWLNVTVKKVDSSRKFKPVKIPVKYPLVDPRTTGVCLIVKDPQREYKDLLESHGIKFISRVVGISKLKGKFKPYEARRALLKENGLFLVDDRVVELMPKLLGVKWFEAKKQPIPVTLKRKDLKGELERAISSTYMNQNRGTCTSIKIANLSHTPAQILANLQLALPAVAKGVYGGWDNIQSLNIKTNASISLPIWNCDLSDRWAGLGATAESSEEEDEEEDMEVDKTPAKAKGSKKRTTEDEEPNPRKKAKGASGPIAPKADEPKAKATESKKPKDTHKPASSKAEPVKSTSPSTKAEASTLTSTTKLTSKKSRKQKQKAVTELEPPTAKAVSTAIETPVEAVVADEPKKRKKAARPTAVELMEEEPPAPAPTPAEPVVEPETKVEKKDKKKKKAEVVRLVEEKEAPAPPKPVEVKEGKKSKKEKKAAVQTAAPSVPEPAVENDKPEVSKKAKAGDKKKEKVTAKSKKSSAKDALLGRKAGKE